MPCIRYEEHKFSAGTSRVIEQANEILAEYEAQGFELTLRQLYSQFVARGLIANTQLEYKRLGSIINDGRLAGLIDWNRLVDRTRNLHRLSHWESPAEIVQICADTYRMDRWAGQRVRVEIWIEKEALAGIFERVADELDCPMFACRGYTSQSEMWSAGQRLRGYLKAKQKPVILHFGDHDPSGLDMTRDIRDRLAMFMGGVRLERLALNMDQVEEHTPPPNPAKTTDSRFEEYAAIYGNESWELDALEPALLAELVRTFVENIRNDAAWQAVEQLEAEGRRRLEQIASGMRT